MDDPLTPEQIDELLGAWALGALNHDERAAVDAALATDADLAARAADLSTIVALLGEDQAVAPPPELRVDLLARAARERPAEAVSDPADLLAARVADTDSVLAGLTPDDWQRPAAPYRWTVHGLVAHLLVVERYTAGQLGLDGLTPVAGAVDHLAMGADQVAAELARPPADTRAAWRAAADNLVAAARAGTTPGLDDLVSFHGWPFSVRGLLTTRAFEIWTHGDDIARAAGRPLTIPPGADLRAMSSFSVGTLPLILGLDRDAPPLGSARVVLTGEGGGTFDLGPGDGPAPSPGPEVLIVLDVVDYCRLVARRATLDEIDATIEGDLLLVDRLVAAAQLLAV